MEQRKVYETEEELRSALGNLGITDDEQRNKVTCALIGHSKIQSYGFGYYNCGRCEELLGDTMAGCYPVAEETVLIGHDCGVCRENYKKLTWKDKIFCPDPFTKEEIPDVSERAMETN